MSTEIRRTDFFQKGRAADNTLVTLTQGIPADATQSNYLTHISASLDAAAIIELYLYGLTKVSLDATVAAQVNLTTNVFTKAGHGLTNTDRVVYHNGGGTSITGLTSGTVYFVVGVSGNDFQLSLTSGGAAIDISGTQSALSSNTLILPMSMEWIVHNQRDIIFMNPLMGVAGAPLLLKCTPGTNDQVALVMSGYTKS